jgi:hypothetical protein
MVRFPTLAAYSATVVDVVCASVGACSTAACLLNSGATCRRRSIHHSESPSRGGGIEDASIESVGEVGASGDDEVAERVRMRLENILDIVWVGHKIGRLFEARINWGNTHHVAVLLAQIDGDIDRVSSE